MSTTMHMDCADKNKVGTAEIEDLRVIPVIFSARNNGNES